MSNSSRIEVATRQHVGAILTSKMITELVKVSFPEFAGGVYPSDAAWKRGEDGQLVCSGKVAYGDAILEYLADNSFKVLADSEIVRMPRKRVAKTVAATPPEVPAAPVVATPEPAQKRAKLKKNKKKASKAA